jgi:hypothetical protein
MGFYGREKKNSNQIKLYLNDESILVSKVEFLYVFIRILLAN